MRAWHLLYDFTPKSFDTAKALLERALALDPESAEANMVLSLINHHVALMGYAADTKLALERAVDLNPNCSLAYGSLGTLYGLVGRTKEAITNQQITIRSNPPDPSIFFRFSGIALAYSLDEQYETAILWSERAINRMPRWFFAHFMLAASYVALDQRGQASDTVKACRATLPDIRIPDLDRVPLKDPAKMEGLRTRLHKAGFLR